MSGLDLADQHPGARRNRRHAGLGVDRVIAGTMAVAALAALTSAAAGAGAGLRVETRTPAALCPDIAEVRRAKDLVLGKAAGPELGQPAIQKDRLTPEDHCRRTRMD